MYEVTDESIICSGWKVVQTWSVGLFRSVIVSTPIVYTPNSWVLRQEGWGPMAVFQSKEDASHFRDWFRSRGISSFANAQVAKCRFVLSDDEGVWKPTSGCCTLAVPEGTYFADAVMVLPDKKKIEGGDDMRAVGVDIIYSIRRKALQQLLQSKPINK